MSKLLPHIKPAISLMAPDRRNRWCDHVIARVSHCDAGIFEMVAQGNVADELEAQRCELRATNGTIRFYTSVATHGDLLGNDKD